MAKKLQYGIEARESLLRGVQTVERAVGSTLGPKGANVAIERPWGSPSVIHDGVSVAKEIDLKDEFENLGAQLVREAAQKTNDSAGDGTTTATILTEAIVRESLKNIAAGANPMMLRRGIESACNMVVENLKKLAKPLETQDEIRQIAVISAQDEEIGGLIAGAIEKLGKDSVITVEESGGVEMSVDYKEGMEFSRGFASHHFINKPDTNEVVINNPYILITDMVLSTVPDFVEMMKKIGSIMDKSKNTSLVIIANDISDQFLGSLVVNKVKTILSCVAVKAPEYGDKQKDMLEDISILTGGLTVFKGTGSLSDIDESYLGHADRVVCTKNSTVIVNGKGKQEYIDQRVSQIRDQIEHSESDFDKEKLQERLAKLTSGIAVINVGANSEMEMREKKERAIDAINATKSAIEEGVVPGGETALYLAQKSIEQKSAGEVGVGESIVYEACTAPFKRLMENSGYNSGQMLEKLNNSDENIGIDVMDGNIKDMIVAGIIDPVKVSRSALQNAVSAGVMIMTTNTLITSIKEPGGSDVIS